MTSKRAGREDSRRGRGSAGRPLPARGASFKTLRENALQNAAFRELARSIPVSLVSFGLDFGLLAFLTEVFRVPYLISAAVSFTAGVTLSYGLSVAWVFSVRRAKSKAVEYGLFVLIGVLGLGMNEALLWFFTQPLGIYYLLSKVIAASIVFFWNFLTRKYVLFR
jgi:putative flippase GtrA